MGSQSKPWWNLYYEVLGTQNPNYTLQDQSDQETQDRRHCSERIVESIFFKGSKDLESTGIAAFDISLNEGFLGLNIDSAKEVILNTIRLLLRTKHWEGNKRRTTENPPIIIKSYLQKVASRKQLDEGELVNHVKEYLTDKNIINQFWICIIDPINSGLRITKFEASSISKCEKCNLVTRHTNLKVCISPNCNSENFEDIPRLESDYFGWVATEQPWPLRVEELTGQTKPLSEQREGSATLSAYFYQMNAL